MLGAEFLLAELDAENGFDRAIEQSAHKLVKLAEEALAEDDAGLASNLALAYLLDGKPEAALRHAEDALGREPSDVITITLHIIIKEVLAGERSCPTSMVCTAPRSR